MAQKKVYDKEFKIQAVKLGREIGFSAAAKELGINVDTLYGWNKRTKLLDFIAFLRIISYTKNNGRDRLFSGPLARRTN